MKKLPILIYQDLDGCLCDLNKISIEFYHNGFRKTIQYLENPEKYPDTKFLALKDMEEAIGHAAFEDFLLSTPEEFWGDMDWMPDGKELWDAIKDYDPIILSSPVKTLACKAGKRRWVKENIGDIRVILESDKHKHTTDNLLVKDHERHYLRILIDDYHKKTSAWKEHGGVAILHTSFASTIQDLYALGISEDF